MKKLSILQCTYLGNVQVFSHEKLLKLICSGYARFKFLTAVLLVMLYHWASGSRLFRGLQCLQNIRNHSPNDMVSHRRRLESSTCGYAIPLTVFHIIIISVFPSSSFLCLAVGKVHNFSAHPIHCFYDVLCHVMSLCSWRHQ